MISIIDRKQTINGALKKYVADTYSELENAEEKVSGDIAYCIETKQWYTLNSSLLWVMLDVSFDLAEIWKSINNITSSMPPLISAGSMALPENETTYTTATTSTIEKREYYGSYERLLFIEMHNKVSDYCPSGYSVKMMISCNINTSKGNQCYLMLNNIATNPAATWAPTTFTQYVCSSLFSISDIILEPTYKYLANGCNLYVCCNPNGYSGANYRIYNPMMNFYYVKN